MGEVSARINEVRKVDAVREDLSARNKGLRESVKQLEAENKNLQLSLAADSKEEAIEIREGEDREAKLTRDVSTLRNETLELQREENKLKANETAMKKRVRIKENMEKNLKSQLASIEADDEKYRDRPSLLHELE